MRRPITPESGIPSADVVLNGLALVAAFLGGFMYALATLLAHVYHRRRPDPTDAQLAAAWPGGLPKVSILKPCKGADPGFDENLRSFLRLDGVPNEVLVAFADEADPGVAIARRVIEEERHPAARVIITTPVPGKNPKVANLVALAKEATGQLHLVADSNVRADRGVLRRVAMPLARPDVGAASCVFQGEPGNTLSARLQTTLFAILVLPSLTAAYLLVRHGNIIGKCFAYKPADLAALGGWEAFQDLLAEDAPFSRELQKRRRKVVIVNGPVTVHVGDLSAHHFHLHEDRWWILNRLYKPVTVIGAMLWGPPFLLALAAGFRVAGAREGSNVLLAATALNLVLQHANQFRFGGGARGLWAVSVESVYLAYFHVTCWFRDRVVWRGHKFRIGRDTRIIPD